MGGHQTQPVCVCMCAHVCVCDYSEVKYMYMYVSEDSGSSTGVWQSTYFPQMYATVITVAMVINRW